MLDNNSETLILGIRRFDGAYQPSLPLYWDKEKGDKGYHSIIWEKTEEGFKVRKKNYIFGGPIEEQAGVILDELIKRSQNNWFWANEPIALFSGAHGFAMEKKLVDKLRELSTDDFFSRLRVGDELHGRKVVVGFATADEILSKQTQWYDTLEASTDTLLKAYLVGASEEKEKEEVRRMVDWLKLISYSVYNEHRQEQARLRYLLLLPKSEERFQRRCQIMCDSMGSYYEAYDQKVGTRLVKRTEDGKRVIVPPDKMFACPENALKALEALREKLTK